MSKKRKQMGGRDRRVYVHGVRHERPDVRRLARVVIEFARAEAEAQAIAEHERHPSAAGEPPASPRQPRPDKGAAA